MSAYQIRLATPSDHNFIYNSYLKSYRSSPEAKHMASGIYFPEHKARLDYLLKTAKIVVACGLDEPEHILGYAVIGQEFKWNVLHYVYVKFPFRHMGVARALVLASCPDFGLNMTLVSHLPRNYSVLSKKYKLVFDPRCGRSK